MTTTDESVRSLSATKELLFDLLNPKETPKVPKYIRARASRCLKHYPILMDMFVEARYRDISKVWIKQQERKHKK